VSFFNAMTPNGIKPIIGYEAFLKFGSRFDRSTAVEAGEKGYYSLILLAQGSGGLSKPGIPRFQSIYRRLLLQAADRSGGACSA
jgi:hypothetical protein